MLFEDRRDAGRRLAAALGEFRCHDCIVLALPRGGVPVGAEVARALQVPLDLLLVRKIGAPRQPELAVGSVMDGGAPLIIRDRELLALTGTSIKQFDRICMRELAEIERRRKIYLRGRAPLPLENRIAIVVDDGLATGSTMRVALRAARLRGPAYLVMAVPVASRSALDNLSGEADQTFCLAAPEPFRAVSDFYRDFRPVEDKEVVQTLMASVAQSDPRVESGEGGLPRRQNMRAEDHHE